MGDDRRLGVGLAFALVSALSFGLSGAIARPMLETGWSPGAVVTLRIAIGVVVVLPWGVASLRGRWSLLARNAPTVVVYGLLAVAAAQFCYFSAVRSMQVAPALLIEFTSPAAVVLWLWVRRSQRPSGLTGVGVAICAVGLVLVLDLMSSSTTVSGTGVAWAFGAMIGAAAYFLISADDDSGLPPLALATAGLVVGAMVLGLLGVVGAMPMRIGTGDVAYAGVTMSPWVAVPVLGVVTAATAYVTGVLGARRLGPRVASFVGLSEALAGVVWSWALLAELPRPVQFGGGALILLGVVAVKLGERSSEERGDDADDRDRDERGDQGAVPGEHHPALVPGGVDEDVLRGR
ncbi:Threonine/homoserine efflux transporter RhtA [Williamsia serinedens]|uniref:Threonine/homoserine efflux transporter RhtA n=1 Tax=Williamsia serinedens TaxID=391736 RepID=A0ABT1H1W3_9NOCA|nr:Threonine/homoserine efflux transporter RhtA [Williamsia serinedens]